MHKSAFVLLLFSLLLLASPVRGTTYYVKPTGSDGASGTSEPNAWQTIGYSCVSILAGDTLLIRSGTYKEGGNFVVGGGEHYVMNTISGTPGNYTVYKGYPGDVRPRIMGDTTAIYLGSGDTSSCCILNNYVILDSIEFTHGFRRGIKAEGTQNSIVKNCWIDTVGWHSDDAGAGNNPGGLSAPQGSRDILEVHDNYFFDNQASGMMCEFGVDSMAIYNNVFEDNRSGVFIKISTNGKRGKDIHIYNNTFIGNAGARLSPVFGIVLPVTAYAIHNLFVHHNVMYGDAYSGADNAAFVMGNDYAGNPDTIVGHFVYIYNNTIDCDNALNNVFRLVGAEKTSGGTPLWDSSGIFNNIIMNPHPYDANHDGVIGMYGYDNGSSGAGRVGPNWDFDYNLIWDTLSGAHDLFMWNEDYSGQIQYTHAEFVAGQGYGGNDKLTDPEVLDRAGRDYRILGSSPAATGGYNGWVPTRGGDSIYIPAYIGAFAPSDTTCPTVTLAGPGDDTTIANTSVTLEINMTVDGAGDACEILLLGGLSSPPADTLVNPPDTVTADTAGYTFTWTGRLEDSTYYWRVIVTDTSCADTSAIRSFLVDSIPPPAASDSSALIRGGYFQGIKIGELDEPRDTRRDPMGWPDVAGPNNMSATGRNCIRFVQRELR